MLKIKYPMFAFSAIALLLAAGCGTLEKNTAEKIINHTPVKEHGETDVHNPVVKLSEKELKEFDIKIESAAPGKLETHVTLSGDIIIPPDNIAHIHPRFSGIVKHVYKNIGDHVKKNEILAVIESNESLTNYNILSLINGTVVDMHLTQGEVVNDGQHGFTIAHLTKVWAYLKVYQKDLPHVQKGGKVRIAAGEDMPVVETVIDYISPVMDETTRTATARVVIDNRSKLWKPGLFVNGEVTTSSRQVKIRIPKTAIEEMNGEKIVFVKKAGGFRPRPISIGKENAFNVEIVSGLKKGELYVSKGGFTLKAQIQKSEFDDDDQ